jgi:2-polyprenyl-3-methyl-5-hydroxy-6-metoxy-1,4-benzoquinol methylase
MAERSSDYLAAIQSQGRSASAILSMVRRVVAAQGRTFERVLDVGCGHGDLYEVLRPHVQEYAACDLVRYDGLPEEVEFRASNLNVSVPFEDGFADLVACVETIEHLENPRALFRELVRVSRPGALLVVTTPNQLSVLSKLCLVVKNRFAAFQDGEYPAHITALLDSDLIHIAREQRLEDVALEFTHSGRIPGTALHWPKFFVGRLFSDNLAIVGRKPKKLVASTQERDHD